MDMTKVPGMLVVDLDAYDDPTRSYAARPTIVVPDELTVDDVVDVSHRNAKERGFWPDHAEEILILVRVYGRACENVGDSRAMRAGYVNGEKDYVQSLETANQALVRIEKYVDENVGPNSPMVAATGIALIMSELAEALEAIRDGHAMSYGWEGEGGKPEGVGSEFADAVVRIADQCGRAGIDLNAELVTKMRYNATRPYRHGGKRV